MSNDLELDEIQKPSLTPIMKSAVFWKREPVKVVLLGDSKVGKTSIINYLVGGYSLLEKDENRTPPGGPKSVGRKRVSTEKGDVILELWDTCGLERYFAVGPQFMRGSNAVVFVYDITRLVSSHGDESFQSIFKGNSQHRSWLDEFLVHWSDQEELLPIVILGNKADLEYGRHHELQTEKVEQRLFEESKRRELKPFLFWETSALTGKNLNDFSKVLGEHFPSNAESWQTGAHFDGNTAVVVHRAEEKKNDEGKGECFPSNTEFCQTRSHFDGNSAVVVHGAEERRMMREKVTVTVNVKNEADLDQSIIYYTKHVCTQLTKCNCI